MPIPTPLQGTQATRVPRTETQHPGYGIDIEQIFDIYAVAEGGRPRLQCDLFADRLQADGKYRGMVAARQAAITGPLAVVLPATDEPDDKRSAQELRDSLEALGDDALHRYLRHQQTSPLMHGWGLTELGWQWNAEAQRYDVLDIWNVRCRNTQIATSSFQPVRALPEEILVQTGEHEFQVERQIPDKFVETRLTDAVSPERAGLGRTSTITSTLKSNGLGDYLILLKRFGLPFPIVDILDWTREEDKQIGRDIIAGIGTDGGVLKPKNARIELTLHDAIAAARSATSDIHGRFLDVCNHEMAVLWLGSVLSTEAGQAGASYALAAEQGNVAFRLLREDAARTERTTRAQWFTPWHKFNGFAGRVPRLKIFITRIENPEVAVRMAKTLQEIGYRVSPDQLLEMTGLRRADNGDDEVSNV